MNTGVPWLALGLALAACGTTRPPRGEEGPPKAVVFCPPALRDVGEASARALNEAYGCSVTLRITPIPRKRSTIAVYGLHDFPARLDELKGFEDTLERDLGGGRVGDVEFLPFQQHATGGNAVVVWLAAAPGESEPQSRATISPATSR